MTEIPRPLHHLRAAGKLYPGAWKKYDQYRQDRGKGGLPDWPAWCYCPMAAAYAIVSGGGDNRVPLHLMADVAQLAALAAWRVTQGIYRFDPDVYEAVRTTPLSGDLPCELLYRLPEWCVYVETPGLIWMRSPLHGFFAHLEWDANTGREELRLLLDSEAVLAPAPLHLGAWPLFEAVRNANKLAALHAGTAEIFTPDLTASISTALEPLLSLLLYLCQDSADYTGPAEHPSNPVPKRTKQGWRLFPPDKPRHWDVAVRMGAALRAARAVSEPGPGLGEGRQSPRGHIRRAHWHTYRTGPGRADSVVKWLPPIPINLAGVDELPTVIHPVQGKP
jgi:hypothetical protein